MEKKRGILCALLQSIFLLQLSSLVASRHDISFWEKQKCFGQSIWCVGASNGECCDFATPDFFAMGLQVRGASENTNIYTYHSGSCEGPVVMEYGGQCNHVLALTGAFFYDFDGRRRSLSHETPACKRQLTPNGLGFREYGSKGHWVVKSSNATHLYSQLASLPVEEKVNWLLSQGAVYEEILGW